MAHQGKIDNQATKEIAVGILWANGKVWIQKRQLTHHLEGYWEFPGGKVEPNETPERALRREIQEEVGLELPFDLPEQILVQDYTYYPERAVRIHFFLCRLGSAGTLTNGRWVSTTELDSFNFPPANKMVLQKIKTLARD